LLDTLKTIADEEKLLPIGASPAVFSDPSFPGFMVSTAGKLRYLLTSTIGLFWRELPVSVWLKKY
jgi:hypothetical protein